MAPNALIGDSLGVAGQLIGEGQSWSRVVGAMNVMGVENGILVVAGLWCLTDNWSGNNVIDDRSGWRWGWLWNNDWGSWGGSWDWSWSLNLWSLNWCWSWGWGDDDNWCRVRGAWTGADVLVLDCC